MNRTREQLTNRMVDRRTLLGGSVGVAAAITLRPAFGFAQDAAVSGDISYWHHFTSDSEMAGLEQITNVFEEEYPGTQVVSENIPNADYMTQFTTAAVGGALPNTAMATLLYSLKTLFGIESMNALPALLFRDEALMQLVGFNA